MNSSGSRGRRALWHNRWPAHPGLRAEATFEVPFQDADPTGVVWHGNYFRYYETARSALLDQLGLSYRRFGAQGQVWPIVDTRVRYRKSIPYGDSITVSAQLVEWDFRLKMYYDICKVDDGDLVNEAFTVQVPVDAVSEELIVGTPSFIRDRIAEAVG